MKKRIIGLSLALVAGPASHAFAQGASDALRYSRLQFGGTARTQGIAGANVALGADFGNLTSNPAGLGLFQRSELHISPGIGLGQSDNRIDGTTSGVQNETKNSFHIASLGAVFAGRRADGEGGSWRGGALALGFTRQADFNMSQRYQGTVGNNQSYLAYVNTFAGPHDQTFINNLDNQATSSTYTSTLGLAYGAYLANVRQSRARVDSAVIVRSQGSSVAQDERVINSGSLSQFDIGYGGSFNDRVYIGGALGFVSSNFTQMRTLHESDNDPSTHFVNLTNQTDLRTKGSGLNLRLGVIVRPTDCLRLGASIQTPTFMRLTDTYSESLSSLFSASGTDRVPGDLPIGKLTTVSRPVNDYVYSLTTPFRANAGAVITLGKHGFVSGDAEYVGYSQARLHSDPNDANGDDYSFAKENSDIQSRYTNALNLRFGAEGRFDVFRVRAGYARYGDPYKADANGERAQNFYTAGAGLRQDNFFIDAAAVYMTANQQYSPYTIGGLEPVIKSNITRYTTTITAGVLF